jgi:glycogen debranching enzyme
VLLDEYHRWTGDAELVRALEPNARTALCWIDDSGDLAGDGYVEYETRNPVTGLVNQCWKDSWNSMQFADGSLARGPIATCEIQGYVYDARRRMARLAREVFADDALAERLGQQAVTLRENFRPDFWMPQRGVHALALNADKRQVHGLSSNIGHLLWSGILDDDEAARTAPRLLDPELYSGWGVRTLGAAEAGYNPLGYHTGTVWPHDNSLIAAGLARYGHRQAAATIADSLLAAAPRSSTAYPRSSRASPPRTPRCPWPFPPPRAPAGMGGGDTAAAAHHDARAPARVRERDDRRPRELRVGHAEPADRGDAALVDAEVLGHAVDARHTENEQDERNGAQQRERDETGPQERRRSEPSAP